MKPETARTRALAAAGMVVALFAGGLALVGAGAASAQEPVLIQAEQTTQGEASCEAVDLGTLGNTPGSELRADGRWTTEDCDSRFRSNSDAHTYRFEIAATGRIRVDVMSSEADSFLYLLDGAGNRIAEIDDGGVERLNARIERELQAGAYLIEATTTAGRIRGPADFEVTVTRVATCEPQILGVLTPGRKLGVTGVWTSESCQSIFLTGHPSQYFAFSLPQGARVRVELKSVSGDSVLIVAPIAALRQVVPGQVAHNDDVDGTRNSRVEQYLSPGIYGIEATTYRHRDLQSPRIEFTLHLSIVEEEAQRRLPLLKIEEVDIPTEVVAGDPVPVNYRAGNLGGDSFPGGEGEALIYTIGPSRGGPRPYDRLQPVPSNLWQASASHHTNDETSSATSTAIPEVHPFSVVFPSHGPSWLFTGIITYDGDGNEIGFYGHWHDLTVLSGPTYDPVKVEVDGAAYSVSAQIDHDAEETGVVVTTVTAVDDPEAEVDQATQEKARYAAGVLTQLLDGIFDRTRIAALPLASPPYSITVPRPVSDSLLKTAATRFAATIEASGLPEALANGEAINPVAVDDVVLAAAERVSGIYVSLAASWQTILRRIDDGEAISFADAVAAHSELIYAESILWPAYSPSEIVVAARAAELGWDDPQVQEMLDGQPSCDLDPTALRDAYEAAGVENVDELIALDSEMRAARPVYGLLIDGALCAAAEADAASLRFLERLALDDSEELLKMFEPEEGPEPEPQAGDDSAGEPSPSS